MNVTEFDELEKSTRALPSAERYSLLQKLAKTVDRDERGNPIEFTIKLPDPEDDEANAEKISQLVEKKIGELQRKHPVSRNPLGIDRSNYDSGSVIPAGIRRGQLKNFRGEGAQERAFRFGSWALATLGNEKAIGWCSDHGIAIVKAQTEGTNTVGGYLVPDILESDIIDLRLEYGVFRRESNVVPMRSDLHTRPRRTGGLTASFVGEGVAGTKSAKTWDAVNLSAKKIITLAIASTELIEDAVISVGDDLAGEIVYAFSQKEDDCGFNGDGSSTYGGIQGITSKLVTINGVDDGGGLVVATGNNYSEFVLSDFNKTVARCPSYARRNAKWYCSPTFNDAVMQRLALAVGGATASDVLDGGRLRFLGYPVVLCENLPTTEANSQVACLFGDLRKSSDFGDRRQTAITFATTGTVDGIDLFSTDQVGIRGTQRFDINNHDLGSATVAGPIVGLITAAS